MVLRPVSIPFCVALFAAAAVIAAPCGADAAPAKFARDADATHEIITFNAGDGLQLPAIVTRPAAGVANGGPIIIHIPDGPGGSPVRAADPARFTATGLAKLGYPSLSIETRHSQQYPFTRFDEAFADVKAAIDVAATRGFPMVILQGTGLGALLAVRYAAEAGDARVKAVVALAPSVDLAAAYRAKIGEDAYAAVVERAGRAGADGFIDLGDGVIFTSAVFLDWYGPNAKTSMTASVAALDKPLFLAAGSDDASVPIGRLQKIAAVAKDGTALDGVMYAPAIPVAGAAAARPTIMVVHGFTGDVLRSAPQWLGQRLAQRGYTVLAVRTRGSGLRNTITTRLDEIPQDLAAWSAFFGARGTTRVVGVGHGIGGLWLSTYLSESQDKRFRGAIYLGPPRDLPAHARRAMGEEVYTHAVREAEAAVKAGRGSSTLISVPFPQAIYEEDPRQPMALPPAATGFTYSYADAFLSYWGPDSLAVHRNRVAEMKIPILAIGGSRDAMMQGGWLLQFIKAAGGPSAAIFYGGPTGASASFDGFEGRVTDDIVGWTERLP